MLATYAARACAQQLPDSLVGTWSGTSTCTSEGRPSCDDEVVVYHLRAHASGGSAKQLEVVMDKVVSGREEEMGTQTCDYDIGHRTMRCPMRGWVWIFQVQRDTLTGTLANPAGIVWRHIRVTRPAS